MPAHQLRIEAAEAVIEFAPMHEGVEIKVRLGQQRLMIEGRARKASQRQLAGGIHRVIEIIGIGRGLAGMRLRQRHHSRQIVRMPIVIAVQIGDQ